jgi:hypothetical protein
MQTTIRIMTRPETYEERKRQLLDAGYEIDREAPVPVNGLCSFRATKKPNTETHRAAACD